MHPNPKLRKLHRFNQFRRKLCNQFCTTWEKLFQHLSLFLRMMFKWIKKGFRSLLSPIWRASRGDRVLVGSLVLVWIAIIIGNFLIPGSSVFEGTLTVREVSFTYTGVDEGMLLNAIDNIQDLDIEGGQIEPITLTGSFSSDDETLNAKLSQLKQLTIELPHFNSRFIVTPTISADLEASTASILELRINSEIQVNQLTYQHQSSKLSFCLQAVDTSPEACPFFTDPSLNSKNPLHPVGNLGLRLGERPLKVTLEAFNLKELNIQSGPYSYDAFTFQFTPEADDLWLTLSSPTQLTIKLPKFGSDTSGNIGLDTESIPPINTNEISQWIRGDIDVKDVRFTQIDTTDNVVDELEMPTILSGEVRMGNEKLEIEDNQFLIIPSNPGIQKLRYIQVQTDPPQGLRTLISGKSQEIAVGFYPEFPVQRIKPTWLSKHLSDEAVNALLAFIAAITGVLLPRLFPESSRDSNSSKS